MILPAVLAGGVAVWACVEHEEGRHHFSRVARGVLYRSRQPDAENLDGLARRNIRLVVNLRTREEDPPTFDWEKSACAQRGATMVNIPVVTALPTDAQIAEFLRVIRANPAATLVHCEMGRSRTGAMVAAYRVVAEGASPAAALAEAAVHNPTLSPREKADLEAMLKSLHENRAGWLARTAPRS